MNWNQYFILLAETVSSKSKDRSTKVGAVLVGEGKQILSTGYNGFARGVNDETEARHERPEKYLWVCHAEQNAVLNAARSGTPTLGSTLYVNFYPVPCTMCARCIIQAGVRHIVGPDKPFTGKGEHWLHELEVSRQMLEEAGVTIETEPWPIAAAS